MFNILPNEVIAKIISCLDDIQLLNINLISKQFKIVHDEYFIDFLKNILTNKGIHVENVNDRQRLKDIYRFRNSNMILPRDYIVGNDGKVYFVRLDFDDINGGYPAIIKPLDNIINIISASCEDKIICLKNDGSAFFENKQILNIYVLLNDIVQIAQNRYNYFCLTSEGKVYVGTDSNYVNINQTFKNIIKIITHEYKTLLLDKNGNVFEFNGSKVEQFENVSDIIMYDNLIYVTNKNGTIGIYNFYYRLLYSTTTKCVNKILIVHNMNVWILNNQHELLHFSFKNVPYQFIIYDTNIKDFSLIANDLLTLHNDNRLILRNFDKNILNDFDINGHIQLLEENIIRIDGHIYYIDQLKNHKVDHGYKLLKVCP